MRNVLFTLPFCFASSLSTAGQLDVLDAASIFGGIVVTTSSTAVPVTAPQVIPETVIAAGEPLITSQTVSKPLPSTSNFKNGLVNSRGRNGSSDVFLESLAAISSPTQIKSWLRASSREETQEVEVLLNELLQFETVTQSEAILYTEILGIIGD